MSTLADYARKHYWRPEPPGDARYFMNVWLLQCAHVPVLMLSLQARDQGMSPAAAPISETPFAEPVHPATVPGNIIRARRWAQRIILV
jgi:hypothetical protein